MFLNNTRQQLHFALTDSFYILLKSPFLGISKLTIYFRFRLLSLTNLLNKSSTLLSLKTLSSWCSTLPVFLATLEVRLPNILNIFIRTAILSFSAVSQNVNHSLHWFPLTIILFRWLTTSTDKLTHGRLKSQTIRAPTQPRDSSTHQLNSRATQLAVYSTNA